MTFISRSDVDCKIKPMQDSEEDEKARRLIEKYGDVQLDNEDTSETTPEVTEVAAPVAQEVVMPPVAAPVKSTRGRKKKST